MGEGKEQTVGMTATKEGDFAEWYPQVVLKAKLADYSQVKGCMVIRPNGYAIWQHLQDFFNKRLQELNVENAYFPLFIPESFFQKEATHAEGFSPEVAWLANTEEGAERLAIRPTSETIMYDMYSKWLRSHRDLPIRINQWANVVRWETKATRLFLRTREFLWQEGHCVYETREQCEEEVLLFINEYKKLAEEMLALPVVIGRKTPRETFAGAEYSFTIESLMPDGKTLQSGTSHMLGQGFAKAFGMRFLGKDEEHHFPWQSSWGFSTRLIGATIMTHSDDKGAVIPPRVAQTQVAIVPILFDDTKDAVLAKCNAVKDELTKAGLRVKLDDRTGYSPGWKFADWELQGVPLRMELGPKDLEKKQAVLVRRNDGNKKSVSLDNIADVVKGELDQIHNDLFTKAKTFLEGNIVKVKTKEEFLDAVEQKKYILAPFCLDKDVEDEIKAETGVGSSCVPLDAPDPEGMKCIWSEKPAKAFVYFAKAY